MKPYLLTLTRAAVLCALVTLVTPGAGRSQSCASLTATVTTNESRCIATGSVQITASGGSGNYNYKVEGPVTTSFTSSNIITGLSAGTYDVIVRDIVSGCTFTKSNVIISGSYSDPRFSLNKTDVTCINGNDGSIWASSMTFGRSPFTYTIVAPSPSAVGTSNTTGIFTNLVPGEYAVQLVDSCGGMQTRRITILNYDWWIDGNTVTSVGCDSAQVSIQLKDNKGNTSGPIFGAFQYAIVKAAGDTIWSSNNSFKFYLGNTRTVQILIKDGCGNKKTVNWTNPKVPNIAATVTNSALSCSTFTVTVTGQVNLTSPQYCLYTSADALISCNSTGIFTNVAYGSYCIKVTDACYDTTITRCFTVTHTVPSVSASVSISNKACATFTATVTGQTNLTNPNYCLYDNSNTLIVCNATGVFNAINYGSYAIKITDGCYDTTITRNFSASAPIPSVGGSVSISNKACATFTATITGKTNLTNPQYFLYDNNNVQIGNNTTGVFNNVLYGSYSIRVQNDACYDTTITRNFSVAQPVPSVAANPVISNSNCTTFTVSVTGQTNLTNPQYCLYDNNDVQIGCNSTGVFNNISHGSYCIKITNDACYDTIITRCFTTSQPVPAGGNVSISSQTCTTFTASVSSGTNLTNPQYCLYDNSNTLITCNSTGSFPGLSYGSYCIKIQNDLCYDTLITRCFSASQPVPSVGASVAVSNKTCSTFTATVSGTNLTNASYCLYDNSNTQVACNSTGIFNSVAYGVYSIRIQNDACYDTLITRNVSATPPVPSVGSVVISNQECSTVTATLTGQLNLTSPHYYLYDSLGNLVADNTTGVFNSVGYGSYCITVVNTCYDTTITRCFTSARLIPSVASTVAISNKACGTFSATITGQTNINNPQYCLYDNGNNLVSCNATGVFNSINYGSYCIKIEDPCYDTVITRCFSVDPNPVSVTLSAAITCNIGKTDVKVVFNSGSSPYQVWVYDPGNNLVGTASSASSTIWIYGLQGLPAGLKYKVIGADQCNVKDTEYVTPTPGTFTKTSVIQSKCPSGIYQDGATDINITASSNLGTVTPSIIKKNGTAVTINYSTFTGGVYKFVDLAPADYIIAYAISGCGAPLYDTVSVASYSYPNLQKSAAYQCDNNSFSVGASVAGGSSPFTYEVIGSIPESPAIISPAQGSPVFGINNGTSYSLVRLRAIDVCGNATLNDVSILPLANTVVTASSNCYYNDIVLSVDTIPNASYEWYRKTSETDSTMMGSGFTYDIPYLLPSDTGVYVCKTSVNSGCLTKIASFHLDGNCGGSILPLQVSLSGKAIDKANKLTWIVNNANEAKEYVVERSISKDQGYTAISNVKASNANGGRSVYQFIDNNPPMDMAYYRLKVIGTGSKFHYSNIIAIRQSSDALISVFPNPVKQVLSVYLHSTKKQNYKISLFSATGQVLNETYYNNILETTIKIQRDDRYRPGMYILRVTNTGTGIINAYRVVFE